MKINIRHSFKKETIIFDVEDEEYSEWNDEYVIMRYSGEITKTVSSIKKEYVLLINRTLLDGHPCSSKDEEDYLHNNMIDTPTGKRIFEQLKDKFTI